MGRERHRATGRSARIGALPALVLAVAAQAQVPGSVQDYHLPPAPTPTPTAAGPVDTEHPVAAPTTRPPVVTLPAPTQSAPAIIAPPVSPEAQPRKRPRPVESASPAPAAPAPAPSSAPTGTTEPVPTPTTVATAPATDAAPAPVATAEPKPAEAAEPGSLWPWLAGGAAVVLALAGFFYWRRRSDRAGATTPETPPAPEARPGPEPSAPATLPPPTPTSRRAPPLQPAPPAPPAPLPEPAFPSADRQQPIEMQLEARHLSRALVNATLAYRLTLTNRTEAALGPLRIAGDIVSAHASISTQEQLTPGDGALATIHQVPALAAGESVVLSGELRLPIASILPIHSGTARVFVPLARFRAETGDGAAITRVFVIGQTSGDPGGALRPFPLDRGPGVDRGLGQRELELPA